MKLRLYLFDAGVILFLICICAIQLDKVHTYELELQKKENKINLQDDEIINLKQENHRLQDSVTKLLMRQRPEDRINH
jgi:hypothetical protein